MYNKYTAWIILKAFLPALVHGKIVFHEISSCCQKVEDCSYRECGLWFWEASMWDWLTLDWVWSGSGGTSMPGHLSEPLLQRGQTRARIQLWLGGSSGLWVSTGRGLVCGEGRRAAWLVCACTECCRVLVLSLCVMHSDVLVWCWSSVRWLMSNRRTTQMCGELQLS